MRKSDKSTLKILEIQGLRALAVTLVIFYHADFLPGGFIGVDIFYVISGYLITNLIIKEISTTGSLNLRNFYQRRIKRLLPASVLVLLITAAVCYLLLTPLDRYQLGRDIIAVTLLLPNYAFAVWENDYQNLGEAASPFIHYWSLAVEEQFYLIWPLFILLFSKLGVKAVKIAILSVFIISLTFSIFQTPNSPIFTFYSLHTRAWELAAGALIVFIPKKHKVLSKVFYKTCSLLGAVLIIWAVYLLTRQSPFPGSLAAIPVFGSFLLIFSIGNWPTVFKNLLNNPLMQRLGTISYPLYLWHWPVLAIPSLVLERKIDLNEKLLAITAILFLAELTHRYIEQPIRYSKLDLSKTFLVFAATTSCLFVAGVVVLNTHTTNIFIKEKALNIDLSAITSLPAIYDDDCHASWGVKTSKDCLYGELTSNKTIVLFGDSHAAQWFDAVERIAINKGFRLISLTKSGCSALKLPISNRGAYNGEECRQWQNNSIERIKKLQPEILLTSAFSHYKLNLKDMSKELYYLKAQKELHTQLDGYVTDMVYLTDTPKPEKNIPRCLAHKSLDSCNQINRSPNAVIKELIKIDPYDWFCNKSCEATNKDFILYRDASHITRSAAKAATAELEQALTKGEIFN
jgi:peptidoglycan/LPS O-acetylase OafA/YrhL